MKCSECKFWKSYDSQQRGECTKWDNVEDERLMVNGWEWDSITTTPDFGCVAFESKKG